MEKAGKLMEKHRKRSFRTMLTCKRCCQSISSSSKEEHIQSAHGGDCSIEFSAEDHLKQSKLTFTPIAQPIGIEHSRQSVLAPKPIESAHGNSCSPELDIPTVAADVLRVSLNSETPVIATSDNASSSVANFKTIAMSNVDLTTNNEFRTSTDHNIKPHQPILQHYNPKKSGDEKTARDFNPKLFKTHPWLTFNENDKTIECFPCLKFNKPKARFKYSQWRMPHKLDNHAKCKIHLSAMEKWVNLKFNRYKNTLVSTQVHACHQEEVIENRRYLKVIIKTLLFTVQQNIAQHNYTEDELDIDERYESNRGSFLELLRFECKYIPWLASKLENSLQLDEQWISSNTQNEIVDIAATQVRKAICTNIAQAGMFSLIVGETTGVTDAEQLSICIRYLTEGHIKESFIGFYNPKNAEGETLFLLVKNVLEDLGLNIANLVGQCYDGPSHMSGKYKVMAAKIQQIVPRAIHAGLPCCAHRLNLALKDTLGANAILRNTLGLIQSLHHFFHTTKRETILGGFSDEKKFGKFVKLEGICVTRWVCRSEAVKSIDSQICRIILALEVCSHEKDSKTSVDAAILLEAVCDFQFLLGLKILNWIFKCTDGLCTHLQGTEVDLGISQQLATATIACLRDARTEPAFRRIWENACQSVECLKLQDIDIEATLHRRQQWPSVGVDCERDATMGFSDEAKVCYEVYFDSIDRISAELSERFADNTSKVLLSLSKIVQGKGTRDDFKEIAAFYSIDQKLLVSECALFQKLNPPGTIKSAGEFTKFLVSSGIGETLPHFSRAAQIFTTIPGTACTAEKSGLRRLETYLGSTMGRPRLTNMALLYLEREMTNNVDIEHIIDVYTLKEK